MISSTRNDQVKWFSSLYARKRRREERLLPVEGPHLLAEAWRAGLVPKVVFWSEEYQDQHGLLPLCRQSGTRVVAVTAAVMKAMTQTVTPQGIAGAVPLPSPLAAEALNGASLVAVADGISDPGNLGTLIRTAHAAGAYGLVYTPGTVDPFNDKVIRSSMGSVFHLPLDERTAHEVIDWARETGALLIAGDVGGNESPYGLDLVGNCGVVVGNEARGPGDTFRRECRLVRLPMPGGTESLNVAVAGAILLYEVVRQRLGSLV